MAWASAAAGLLPGWAEAQVVNACVNRANGDVRIVAPGAACPSNAYPLQWNQPQVVATPPPPELHVQVLYGETPPGFTGFARAYCPPTWKVLGGGGFARTPFIAVYASVPIATTDGEIAGNENAIGWQVSAAEESIVQAYAVCGKVY